jgi:hypothetical protein
VQSVVGTADDRHGLAGEHGARLGLTGTGEHRGARIHYPRRLVGDPSDPGHPVDGARPEGDNAQDHEEAADGDDVEAVSPTVAAPTVRARLQPSGHLAGELFGSETSRSPLHGRILVVTHRRDLGKPE